MKENLNVEFWLIYNKQNQLRLPVNPEANTYESPFNYEDYEVEGLGEVTNIKQRGLREFTIESFFPSVYNPSYCEYNNFPSPQDCYSLINGLRNKREPIRYLVTGAGGVDVKVTIRDFSINANKYGAPGDIYYTLILKEYRDVKVTVTDLSKPNTKPNNGSSSSRPPAPTPTKVASYTVKSGDSLWLIAKKKEIYGDGNQWRKIYNANKNVIGSNPNKLKIGMKLVIPR
ncbi:LysM peptidoglycan-binding domain-containing protein [Bacillus massiliigorillae]|uniref:LysM peptidoglycan-binding domain-containing protein n=1 Tax=Bacillus massiliigorillae TaxID=1243664 RepID=UPI00039E67ED|nr:LysM peptidoglycan-binding domain-containing protein [Bacillus massiliigorillae]